MPCAGSSSSAPDKTAPPCAKHKAVGEGSAASAWTHLRRRRHAEDARDTRTGGSRAGEALRETNTMHWPCSPTLPIASSEGPGVTCCGGTECRKGRGKVLGIVSTREHVFFCTRISNLKFLIGTKWNHLKFPWHTTAPGLQQGETDSTQKFANKLVQSQWSGKGSKGEDRENSKLHCLCCKTVANLGYKRNMALLSPEKGWW